MKIKIILFNILFTTNLLAAIEYYPHNYFNFYRNTNEIDFTINSNNEKIKILHYREPTEGNRNVFIISVNQNLLYFGDSLYNDPFTFQKGDSAKGKILILGGNITRREPRVGIQGKGDVYLMMLRLNPDSSRNYGWLKFNISADCDSLYFISSGFNTIINDPVVAGEGEWALSKSYFNPDFKLYPNPSSAFRLKIPDSYFNSNIFIEIMDLSGKIIHKNPYQNQPFSLPIPNGLYWVIIKNENEILSQIRWVKH